MGIIRTPQELATDATPLSFGKYRGRTPDWIAENDPQYLVWAYGKVKNLTVCSFPLAKSCGYVDFTGRDPSAADLPLADRNEKERINPYAVKQYDPDEDDDIPF